MTKKASLILGLLEARYCLLEDYASPGVHPVEAAIIRLRNERHEAVMSALSYETALYLGFDAKEAN